MEAAWSFDPQLYPGVALAGSDGSSSSSDRLLHCGSIPWAAEQEAAARKLLPRVLLQRAARTLRPWVCSGSDGSSAGGSTAQVLQEVVSSTMQLSQMLLMWLQCKRGIPSSDSSTALSALPDVLRTTEFVMPGSSSSRAKAAAAGDKADATSSSSSSPVPPQPLLELQRVIRLGSMDASRGRSSSDYTAAGSSASKPPDTPPDVAAALEGGFVARQAAAAAATGQLLAVCRGQSVGIMDGRLLAAELCGGGIFSPVSGCGRG
jgi:hypothetical protein